MILIIGGANQGKKDYAIEKFSVSQWLDGGTCSKEEVFRAKGICHFELLVERLLQEQTDLRKFTEEVLKINPDIIIITNELGCGLVPVDAFARRYREEHGRICTYLASQAKEVHRVMCGIGKVIKG